MPLQLPRALLRPLVNRPSVIPTSTTTTRLTPRFLSSTPRPQLKEDQQRSPEELEQTKQSQLDKQRRGEGHWHEELASAGEANIAADRDQVHDHDEHMEDLQRETAGKAEREKQEGKGE